MRSKKSLTAGFASRNVAAMQPTGSPLKVHGHAMNLGVLTVLRSPGLWIIRGWKPYPDRQEEPT